MSISLWSVLAAYAFGVLVLGFASMLDGYKPSAWLLRGLGWPLLLLGALIDVQRNGKSWP